jgi:hypothetical protein
MTVKELITELQKLDEEVKNKEIYLVVEPYCGKMRSIYIDNKRKLVLSTEK